MLSKRTQRSIEREIARLNEKKDKLLKQVNERVDLVGGIEKQIELLGELLKSSMEKHNE